MYGLRNFLDDMKWETVTFRDDPVLSPGEKAPRAAPVESEHTAVNSSHVEPCICNVSTIIAYSRILSGEVLQYVGVIKCSFGSRNHRPVF